MPDFTSSPFDVSAIRRGAYRVDVELHGVDQAVLSYEGRIFLNNAAADRTTERNEDQGYLGSFSVFGKVECWGEDEGHCHPASDRKFDRRRPPGRHAKVRVTVPSGRIERLTARDGDEATLSIVAVQTTATSPPEGSPLRFDRLSLICYG